MVRLNELTVKKLARATYIHRLMSETLSEKQSMKDTIYMYMDWIYRVFKKIKLYCLGVHCYTLQL